MKFLRESMNKKGQKPNWIFIKTGDCSTSNGIDFLNFPTSLHHQAGLCTWKWVNTTKNTNQQRTSNKNPTALHKINLEVIGEEVLNNMEAALLHAEHKSQGFQQVPDLQISWSQDAGDQVYNTGRMWLVRRKDSWDLGSNMRRQETKNKREQKFTCSR